VTEPRKLNWREWLFVLGFILSLVIVVVFALQAFRHAAHLRAQEPIHPWMTLPYIAHAYNVPSSVLYQALGLPHVPHDRRPIAVIARQQGRSLQSVIATIQEAIRNYRPPSPTPQPFSPEQTPPSMAPLLPGSAGPSRDLL
jgi:hypothetical protein